MPRPTPSPVRSPRAPDRAPLFRVRGRPVLPLLGALSAASCTLVLDLPSSEGSTGGLASTATEGGDAAAESGTAVEPEPAPTESAPTEDPTTSEGLGTSAAPDSSTSDGTSTGASAGGGTTTGGLDGQPNDSPCEVDAECQSGACFIMGPLGGYCGECLVDDDCPDGGCSIPQVVLEPVRGATCNAGEIAAGCQSDAACGVGLQCELIFVMPGIIENSTCGECSSDADCDSPDRCAPDYDYPALGGAWRCVALGSVPNGGGCDLIGGGDSACESGRCAAAELVGVAEVGVCGECDSDDDCGGRSCAAPSIDLSVGATPSACI